MILFVCVVCMYKSVGKEGMCKRAIVLMCLLCLCLCVCILCVCVCSSVFVCVSMHICALLCCFDPWCNCLLFMYCCICVLLRISVCVCVSLVPWGSADMCTDPWANDTMAPINIRWLRLKDMDPICPLGKWKQRLRPAVCPSG